MRNIRFWDYEKLFAINTPSLFKILFIKSYSLSHENFASDFYIGPNRIATSVSPLVTDAPRIITHENRRRDVLIQTFCYIHWAGKRSQNNKILFSSSIDTGSKTLLRFRHTNFVPHSYLSTFGTLFIPTRQPHRFDRHPTIIAFTHNLDKPVRIYHKRVKVCLLLQFVWQIGP